MRFDVVLLYLACVSAKLEHPVLAKAPLPNADAAPSAAPPPSTPLRLTAPDLVVSGSSHA